MNETLRVYVEGIGAWSATAPDWTHLRALLRGEAEPSPPSSKPAPALLAPGERRRVPVSALIAIEAASQAVAMRGRDAADLPSLFLSAHGDGPVLDYMCATLATAPAEMSPTRFHNSVHNAAAGYWTIATGCHAASCASSALDTSFGAGLLEVVSQVLADQQPVLLVVSDVAGCGPLAEAIASTEAFGCALVLAPQASSAAVAQIELSLQAKVSESTPQHACALALAANNVAAHGMPLLESLAGLASADLRLNAADQLSLAIHMENIA
ncbi:MAG: beta-ketoacyl synthase chain length factor [Xanthomonadales bacterium]|nr:beta-ketoacyl synthase chain length factor [Xanthomonadales bacterium]